MLPASGAGAPISSRMFSEAEAVSPAEADSGALPGTLTDWGETGNGSCTGSCGTLGVKAEASGNATGPAVDACADCSTRSSSAACCRAAAAEAVTAAPLKVGNTWNCELAPSCASSSVANSSTDCGRSAGNSARA
ncbi:hypothetical protein SDC9_185665 [bioreactor metagenome]|uniref:Uncharacterized protein n=1 Tax=bioreactor metagenome TaxID=1076179 RepID=A0A645HGJ0_9ZZZZ